MGSPLRVAIVGASGIGRHHANWHDAVGSRVCAFVGTTPERCHETARALTAAFGFEGRSYTSIDEMLQRERPDIVDICSPNHTHHSAVLRALDAGCHVLCEKPLVGDDTLDTDRLLAQAEALAVAAERSGRHLAMCSQLVALLPQYDRLVRNSRRPRRFMAEMDTASRGVRRAARDVWIDMGPHPLSLILGRLPRATLDDDSVNVRFNESEAQVEFSVSQEGHSCSCRVVVRDLEGPPLQRRFGFDGQDVDLAGEPGDDGYYRSVMIHGDRRDVGADAMHLMIGQFSRLVQGEEETPLVDARTAIRNLHLQLEIARRG